MTKLQAIEASKTFRKKADELLQEMKEHLEEGDHTWGYGFEGEPAVKLSEVYRHHQLSINALEECIMRQGMALKYIGNPDPYPTSKFGAEDVAKLIYTRYCQAVGGVAFNGDPLPDWDTFSKDPAKQKQTLAWIEAARAHPVAARVEPTSDGLKM